MVRPQQTCRQWRDGSTWLLLMMYFMNMTQEWGWHFVKTLPWLVLNIGIWSSRIETLLPFCLAVLKRNKHLMHIDCALRDKALIVHVLVIHDVVNVNISDYPWQPPVASITAQRGIWPRVLASQSRTRRRRWQSSIQHFASSACYQNQTKPRLVVSSGKKRKRKDWCTWFVTERTVGCPQSCDYSFPVLLLWLWSYSMRCVLAVAYKLAAVVMHIVQHVWITHSGGFYSMRCRSRLRLTTICIVPTVELSSTSSLGYSDIYKWNCVVLYLLNLRVPGHSLIHCIGLA